MLESKPELDTTTTRLAQMGLACLAVVRGLQGTACSSLAWGNAISLARLRGFAGQKNKTTPTAGFL